MKSKKIIKSYSLGYGCGSIVQFENDKRFWFIVKNNGKQIRKCCFTEKLKDAKLFALEFLKNPNKEKEKKKTLLVNIFDVFEKNLLLQQKRGLLHFTADKSSLSLNYRNDLMRLLKRIVEFFKLKKIEYIEDVNHQDFADFLVDVKRRVKLSSFRNNLMMLKKITDVVPQFSGKFEFNKIGKPQNQQILKDADKNEIFTRDEIRKILDASTGELHILFYVAVETGLRLGDVVCLTWDNIHFDDFIVLEEQKTSKENIKYAPKSIKKIWALSKNDKYILPKFAKTWLGIRVGIHSDSHGNIPAQIKPNPNFITRKIRKFFDEIGIKKTYSSFRPTYATMKANSGVSLVNIQRALNHSNAQTTKDHYIQQSLSDRKLQIMREEIGNTPIKDWIDRLE